MASRSERILITGSKGFTGQPLVKALASKGHEVMHLTANLRPAEDSVDLRDTDAVNRIIQSCKPDVVVHLAGITYPAHPSAAELYSVNVVGTANLLGALARSPPRLTLIASSSTVYSPSETGKPICEGHPLRPINHYAVSKLAVEQMAKLVSRDMPIQIVRPFNYTGTGQGLNFLIPKIVHHYTHGARELRVGNLDLYRDIGAIKDVVAAYMRLIELQVPGDAVNLCTGTGTHLAAIPELLQEITGHSPVIIIDPTFVRAGEPSVIVGDRSRLDSLIGTWTRQSLETLLREMVLAERH